MSQQFLCITPDEQSQEIMSFMQSDLSDSTATPNPDVLQQMNNDPLLYQTLQCVLNGVPSTDQELQKLNDQGKLIIEMVVTKKQQKNKKRVEENQKFSFKKVLTHIQSQFHKKHRNPMKKYKKVDQLAFYEHYFKQTAERLGRPLQHFTHPQKYFHKYQRKLKIGTITFQAAYKSFSQPYIKLIMQSQSFRQEALSYLKNQFVRDCLDETNSKLGKMINFCSKMYENTIHEYELRCVKSDDEYFRNFVRLKMDELILRNSKCKIPWSQSEIVEAQKFALQKIEQFIEME